MMKNLRLIMIALLIAVVLIGCNSEEGTEQTANDNEQENNEPVEEVNEEPEENEETRDMEENSETEEESDEEFSQESKEAVLNSYPDDLRIGDFVEFERDDITHDHVKLTLNSFKFVEELNGTQPENDRFLLVNITIENLIDDYNYEAGFARSYLEGEDGATIQNEREELELELTPKEGGISTGDIVFDVKESDYYRIYFLDDFFLLFEDEQSSAE